MGFQGNVIFTALILLLFSFSLRLLSILPHHHRTAPPPRRRGTPTHILIVLGSGGHTAEMFSLLQDLDPRSYTYRSYVISAGDSFSALKAVEFEQKLSAKALNLNLNPSINSKNENEEAASTTESSTYTIHTIPRARAIHQPLLTTPLSALRCLRACITLLRTLPTPPDLILLNGPGTAVMVVLATLVLRFFGMEGRSRSIYIESWARVKKMSLSGRILAGTGAVDRVLVQWEGLKGGRGGAEWMGWMVR